MALSVSGIERLQLLQEVSEVTVMPLGQGGRAAGDGKVPSLLV